jgi:hypothetical protein
MTKRLGTIAIVVAAIGTAAGLFASPSKSAERPPNCSPLGCVVALTGTGPSPSTLKMHAGGNVDFYNPDSVTHTVVFENGLCSLALTPLTGSGGLFGLPGSCNDPFWLYAGSYAYTVDGKFTGTVVTTPWRRSVTLKARTHTVRRGTRLTLHGRVSWNGFSRGTQWFPVIVLARHDSNHPFKRIATVPLSWGRTFLDRWNLAVQPSETTTYIAKVAGQFQFKGVFPHGQLWTNARSRPFTIRVRH